MCVGLVVNYASSGVGENIKEDQFAYLGSFLYTAVCNEWLKLICNIAKPPIEYPSDCLVGKHARKVIYYVAGWTLYSASKALTKGIADRLLFQEFAQSQSINADNAKDLGLPTSLVDMRKRVYQGTAPLSTLNLFVLLRVSSWPICRWK